MSATRRGPVDTVGAVNVLAPTAKAPYYRLTWTNTDGTAGRTSAGRDLDEARAKAADIDAWLARHAKAGVKGSTPLAELVARYTSTSTGRNQRRRRGRVAGDWSKGYLIKLTQQLARATAGFGKVAAMDVDADLLDLMRAQAGTPRTVYENTKALRGLVRWAAANGYLSREQGMLLPDGAPAIDPAQPRVAGPARRRSDRAVGEDEDYIRDEDAPSREAIIALGDALEALCPGWGKLAVEIAHGTGLRWGEQFALTADHVGDEDGIVVLAVQWQIDTNGGSAARGRRSHPKGGKTRDVPVFSPSVTGYDLAGALRARAETARQEQAAGRNPDALLFPAPRGGLWHHTSWNNDRLAEAMVKAGWPYEEWDETVERVDQRTRRRVSTTIRRRRFTHTWHSLRHRFARTCVDVLDMGSGELMAVGGWESEQVVRNRYYRSGREHFISALEKVRQAIESC